MTLPAYYTPERIGQVYLPAVAEATQAGKAAGLSAADADRERIYLLLVDEQLDFVHPDGALAVPGAVDDTRRVVEWLYAHAEAITRIGVTLDSHIPVQIFSPSWWADTDGQHPEPFTPISANDVHAGRWQPLYEVDWSREYVDRLEADAKKQLMIWPYHTLIGTPGHTLVPALYEAVAYHSNARQTNPQTIIKGMIPRSEHYSALEPEVKVPEHPNGELNTDLLDEIASYDRVYIAGQAKSHCVLESVTSMMHYYPPEVIGKLHLLTDAMSSVAHPEIDFDALADETFAGYQEAGLNLVTTADGLG